jgi:hypothetical protein
VNRLLIHFLKSLSLHPSSPQPEVA